MLTRRRPSFDPPLSTREWGGRSTRAEVNLDALAHNVRALKNLIAPAELIAVVKAEGYGHGAVRVAEAAVQAGAERLAVYTVSEGVDLRRAGITAPILIFGPFEPDEAAAIVRSQLTPTILNLASAEALARVLGAASIPFHLKIDTGLSRSGVPPGDARPLMDAVSRLGKLVPEGIYTHFASADEPDGGLTRRQLTLFLSTIADLEAAGHRFALKHAANTAAALKLPEARLDAVRCGIGIYGYYPGDAPREVELLPVLALLSSITRLVEVEAGGGVGYGHEFIAPRPCRIGLVPIGYGDGLPRELGNGRGHVLVRGQAAPLAGRVSMDQISVDVTEIVDAGVGDLVTVIGPNGEAEQSADDLAAAAGTISYDVLTRIMPRVPRLYRRSGELSLPPA